MNMIGTYYQWQTLMDMNILTQMIDCGEKPDQGMIAQAAEGQTLIATGHINGWVMLLFT